MILVGHQAVAGLVAVVVMLWLLHNPWTYHHPRMALILWQVSGLTFVISMIGGLLGFGLAPFSRGLLPALFEVPARFRELDAWHLIALGCGLTMAGWLLVNQLFSFHNTARVRARHRLLLQLVAAPTEEAFVVDHPIAVAYCLPGRNPHIVVSAGARRLLTDVELDAVLEHERAHARERHHLVMAPFQALQRILPGNRLLTQVARAIELLVEMRADDRAARRHGTEPLASALERFHHHGFGGVPAGAFAAADTSVDARIRRLREPGCAGTPLEWLPVCLSLLTALVTSVSLFAVPL